MLAKLFNSIRENNKHLADLVMCPPLLQKLYELVPKNITPQPSLDNIATTQQLQRIDESQQIDLSDPAGIISLQIDQKDGIITTNESDDDSQRVF